MQITFAVSYNADGIVRIGGFTAVLGCLQRPFGGTYGPFADNQPLRRIVISYVLGIVKTGEGVMPEYDGIDGIGGPGLAGGRYGNLCLCNRCTAERKQKRGKKFVHTAR